MRKVMLLLLILALLQALLVRFNVLPLGKALPIIIGIVIVEFILLVISALVLLYRASRVIDDLID